MNIFHNHHEVRRAGKAYKIRILNNMNGIGNWTLIISLCVSLSLTWFDIGLSKAAKTVLIIGVVAYLIPLTLQICMVIHSVSLKRSRQRRYYR